MSGLLASDLDGTLIFPLRTGAGQVVEIYEGREITVADPRTLTALGALAARAAFVPVTTRSVRQLERVTPIWELAREGWAICANGATLLHAGRVDPQWDREVGRACAGAAPVPDVRRRLERAFAGAPWLASIRDCDERFLYLTLRPGHPPARLLGEACALLDGTDWRAVPHGRKLYLLPRGLCKGRALAHLLDRLGTSAMTAGDSLLDVELLAAGAPAWCPAGAELQAFGAVPEGVTLTRGEHVAAGREIAEAAALVTIS